MLNNCQSMIEAVVSNRGITRKKILFWQCAPGTSVVCFGTVVDVLSRQFAPYNFRTTCKWTSNHSNFAVCDEVATHEPELDYFATFVWALDG